MVDYRHDLSEGVASFAYCSRKMAATESKLVNICYEKQFKASITVLALKYVETSNVEVIRDCFAGSHILFKK